MAPELCGEVFPGLSGAFLALSKPVCRAPHAAVLEREQQSPAISPPARAVTRVPTYPPRAA